MNDIEFVEGLRVYAPHENAPDFVIANMTVEREVLINWLQVHPANVRIDIKRGKSGKYYAAVNNYQRKPMEAVAGCPQPETPYKPPAKPSAAQEDQPFTDDIPF